MDLAVSAQEIGRSVGRSVCTKPMYIILILDKGADNNSNAKPLPPVP